MPNFFGTVAPGHMNHHMGQAAGLVESLDVRVALYLKEIIRNGCRRVKELQSRASEFVLINRIKLEKCHSKIDQENVAKQTEEWARWNQVFFSPRYTCSLCQEICA